MSYAPRSTGTVARQLGVPEHRLANLVRHGLIPGPSIVGGRRLWSPEDFERARAVLAARGVLPAAAQETAKR